jgi:mono/diheme cytochrome c family protein
MSSMPRSAAISGLLLLAHLACPVAARAEDAAAGKEFFEKRIRPVLVRHCYECHSAAAKAPKGKLRLDSREAARAGGESGPAVVPGKPDEIC